MTRADNPIYAFCDAMTPERAKEIDAFRGSHRETSDECVQRGWIPEDWNFQWLGEQIDFRVDELLEKP